MEIGKGRTNKEIYRRTTDKITRTWKTQMIKLEVNLMAKRKTTKQRNEELAKEERVLRYYGLRLRMEPTEKQKEQIHQTSGCARFTFNFFLGEKKEVYQLTQESLNSNEFKKAFN